MPLPLLGAGALAAAAYGVKKFYDGYQKHSEADEIVKNAEARYKQAKENFEEQERETNHALSLLGDKELKIGKAIHGFKILSSDLLKKLEREGAMPAYSICQGTN